MPRRKSKIDRNVGDYNWDNFDLPDQLPKDAELHQFSERHEEAMKKLFRGEEIPPDPVTKEINNLYTSKEIKHARRLIQHTRRNWSIATAFIFLFFITISVQKSDSAATQLPLVDVVIEWFQDKISFYVKNKKSEVPPDRIEVYFEPAWIPDGYVKSDKQRNISLYQITFRKKDADNIYYHQYSTNIFSEKDINDKNIKKIQKKGVVYFLFESDYQNKVYRFDDQYSYFVSGTLPIKQLLKTLENLTNENP